jgi:hypothetical protein
MLPAMGSSLYLINPRADFPTYYGAEFYEARGYRPAAFLADLDTPADYVGITGKISQWGRMRTLAREFRERGKTVLIGGPHASLSPELVRPHCDVLVRDEIEEIADELFADLRQGRPKEEYAGGRPDLALTPAPRWELFGAAHDRVLTATVRPRAAARSSASSATSSSTSGESSVTSRSTRFSPSSTRSTPTATAACCWPTTTRPRRAPK